MTPAVFEGKYEIDSLCAFLKLSYWSWKMVDIEFLLKFANADWIEAADLVVETSKNLLR